MNNDINFFRDAESWFKTSFNKLYNSIIKTDNSIIIVPVIIKAVNSDGTANIVFPSDLDTIIPNIKVNPGVTIAVGNTAYAIALNRNFGNMFIAFNL